MSQNKDMYKGMCMLKTMSRKIPVKMLSKEGSPAQLPGEKPKTNFSLGDMRRGRFMHV
jgi:hypothetical protein